MIASISSASNLDNSSLPSRDLSRANASYIRASATTIRNTQQALHDYVIRMQRPTLDTNARPEFVERGSKFLVDPNWPPLNALNAIATIFVKDFIKEQEEEEK